jgi:hypothetical protein
MNHPKAPNWLLAVVATAISSAGAALGLAMAVAGRGWPTDRVDQTCWVALPALAVPAFARHIYISMKGK